MEQLPYTYIQSEKYLYTVGHYSPAGWIPESDHETTEAAAARVHYLNGGNDEKLKAERDSLLESCEVLLGELKAQWAGVTLKGGLDAPCILHFMDETIECANSDEAMTTANELMAQELPDVFAAIAAAKGDK